MKALSAVVVVVAALAAVAVATSVRDLDDRSLDTLVGGPDYVLLEFYAPWCTHCKRFESVRALSFPQRTRGDAEGVQFHGRARPGELRHVSFLCLRAWLRG